jgi:hypothetical protein
MIGLENIVVPGTVERCDVVGEERQTIRTGDLLVATGWILAADSPIEQVWVTIDGTRSAAGSKGYERQDVADVYARPDGRFSGFRAILTVDGLGAGAHQVIVEAMDAQGRFLRGDGEPYTFEISDEIDTARGKIESVRVDDDEVDPDEPIEIRPESVVSLSGWAICADRNGGIAAFLRGDSLIPIAYGFERPDIAEAFGESALLAGFESTIDAGRIEADGGRYEIVLIAPDARSLIGSGIVLRFVAASNPTSRRTLHLSGD